MENLSIEEKAKRYDEALKILHKYDGANIMFSQSLKEEMFPELKESEDEKIRKELIRFVKGCFSDETSEQRKAYLTWLEKQHSPEVNDAEMKEILRTEYEKGRADAIAEMQNAWSEKDEEMLEDVRSNFEFNREKMSDDLIEQYNHFFDKIKYLQSQLQQEWSEEDERILVEILKIFNIENFEGYNIGKNNEDALKFLKSLKGRIQPQNGYNPYKEVVESIAEMCKHYDKASHSGLRDFYDNVKVKCKDAKEYDSLYPQNRWNPTEEQMKILNEVLNFAANHESPYWNDYIFGTLNNLIRQLKKLRSNSYDALKDVK